MRDMTFGSLFSGIGGMDLGLERVGFNCRWQVEIDDYATRVLEKNWPHIARHRDVRECGIHNLEPVDLICGGFPCQDISLAGKGEGLAGKRSGLWKEFYRIIRELRPRYVLVENVAALRSRGLPAVLSDLAAVRYDAEWYCIPASAVGAPHQRDRIWIVAYTQCGRRWQPAVTSDPAPGTFHPEEREESTSLPGSSGQDLADPFSERCNEAGSWQSLPSGQIELQGASADASCIGYGYKQTPLFTRWNGFERFDWWAVEPDVGRVAHGISSRVDRIRCLGNAVVPQIIEVIASRILTWNSCATWISSTNTNPV